MKLGFKRAFRRVHWMAACLAIAGCTVTPVPLERGEREQVGEQARTLLFANQEALTGPISLAEATARSVKYYTDYRLRNMEEVLSEANLDVARFDLLPRITASAGYTTRNNDSFGFGFSPGGTVAANPSASSERSRSTLNLGFAWNILDFGVSYFKAKQLADHYAEHEGKPFYAPLIEFMSSGPIVAIRLEGDRVIEGFRALAGATDPTTAAPGTIRGDLGRDWGEKVQKNLVHGSDSVESATRELGIWFS